MLHLSKRTTDSLISDHSVRPDYCLLLNRHCAAPFSGFHHNYIHRGRKCIPPFSPRNSSLYTCTSHHRENSFIFDETAKAYLISFLYIRQVCILENLGLKSLNDIAFVCPIECEYKCCTPTTNNLIILNSMKQCPIKRTTIDLLERFIIMAIFLIWYRNA